MEIRRGRTPTWYILLVEIAIATFVVLIFAEFIPRAIFRARSTVLMTRLALVTDFFYQMFSPIAEGFISLAEWMLKYVFNVRIDKHKEPLSHSELKNLFQQDIDEERQDRQYPASGKCTGVSKSKDPPMPGAPKRNQ